ncbi:MAG: hypothetical protein V3U39_05565, partial [Acidimicrobiia bacterium]
VSSSRADSGARTVEGGAVAGGSGNGMVVVVVEGSAAGLEVGVASVLLQAAARVARTARTASRRMEGGYRWGGNATT